MDLNDVHGCPVYGGLRWNASVTRLGPANDIRQEGLVRWDLGDRGLQNAMRSVTRVAVARKSAIAGWTMGPHAPVLWCFEDAGARILCSTPHVWCNENTASKHQMPELVVYTKCTAGPARVHQLAGTRTTQMTSVVPTASPGAQILLSTQIPIPYTPETPMSIWHHRHPGESSKSIALPSRWE
ncbi:uncharacterized protein GLRG_08726 [Colletotrichum graminicola M1.001]|uniref:Uncharacterized protein n=1 Tax=Colletotrichum graminicola (strain M1.001 / M2 / FGSC 10212) TaxID=645133 RepID=E3QRF9_COLGM|nr:uncharacterized protein GLRG_08726 [Colletotrichum graminicola M1.001]EFQ33447.1 hypothetical protein GLRG_08726 [Colletotrichum graminicola M1.001]